MSQVRPAAQHLLHVEDALHKTGWGLYYKFLVGFATVNSFTNGFVLLCVHFALPLSACDTLLAQNDVTNIFVCFVIGKSIGGFFLSSTSDNTGKRCMISKTLIIIFGSCFVSAFSHNMYTLYLAAFFLGSGIQANIVAMKIYLAEILPADKRGFYLVLPDLFWTAGYFATSVLVYYFGTLSSSLPQRQGMDMRLTSWRIIFAIGGGLCITLACASALLEMSPRFLLFKRRFITASLILKQFYAINRSKYSETFDIHSQQLVDLICDFNINIDPEPIGMMQQITVVFKVMLRMLKILLKRRFLKILLILTLVKLPSLFGMPGWNMYLSQLVLNRNLTAGGENFIHLGVVYHQNCTISFDDAQFENFLLLSVNILLAQIILLCIIDKIGRKFPIFAGLSTCCLTSIALAFNGNFAVLAVAASLFIFGLTLVESTICVIVIESFPTAIRGTATGVVCFYAFITSSLMYNFPEINRLILMLIFAVLTSGTAMAVFFVPDMKGRPMIE